MSEQIDPTPPSSVRALVLLDAAPTDMGAVLGVIHEGLAERLAGLPLQPAFGATIDGVPMTLGAVAAPVTDPALQRDLGSSPVRALLEPVVAGHSAHVTLECTPPDDFAATMFAWTNALALLMQGLGGRAVWIPSQWNVTTDVLFFGDMDEPARNFARVHAMRLDEQHAVAFSAGLGALGGREVQLRREGSPASLFDELRVALAALVAAGALPTLGGTLTVGGVVHRLVEGTHVLGAPVLELVPDASAQPPARRRWFGRARS